MSSRENAFAFGVPSVVRMDLEQRQHLAEKLKLDITCASPEMTPSDELQAKFVPELLLICVYERDLLLEKAGLVEFSDSFVLSWMTDVVWRTAYEHAAELGDVSDRYCQVWAGIEDLFGVDRRLLGNADVAMKQAMALDGVIEDRRRDDVSRLASLIRSTVAGYRRSAGPRSVAA